MRYDTILQRFHGYAGTKHNQTTDRESGIAYMIVRGPLDLDAAAERWRQAGAEPEGYHCSHQHDCCGCGFSGDIYLLHTSRLTVICQSFGINI